MEFLIEEKMGLKSGDAAPSPAHIQTSGWRRHKDLRSTGQEASKINSHYFSELYGLVGRVDGVSLTNAEN